MFGVDLSEVRRSRSWRWFRTRLTYLMSVDGPLARVLAPEQEPAPAPSWSADPPPEDGSYY